MLRAEHEEDMVSGPINEIACASNVKEAGPAASVLTPEDWKDIGSTAFSA